MKDVDLALSRIKYPTGVNVTRILSQKDLELVVGGGLRGVDYRATINNLRTGLCFDNSTAVQAYTVNYCDYPIAVTNYVIEPEPQTTYLRLENGAIKPVLSNEVFGDDVSYLLSQGLLMALENFGGMYTGLWINMLKTVADTVKNLCPQKTWMEVIAQGKYYGDSRLKTKQYDKDMIENFSVPQDQSKFSVALAKRLGLTQVPGICSALSFGPVFIKQLK